MMPGLEPGARRVGLSYRGTETADALRARLRRSERGARELLRLPGAGAGDGQSARARRVLLYGSQPFFVAEPYTARPGVFVPYTETLRIYAGLVAGAYDDLPEEALRFTGAVAT